MNGISNSKPVFQADGSVIVPEFVLPVSPLLSEQAATFQRMRATVPAFDAAGEGLDATTRREQINTFMAPQIERLRAMFAVNIEKAELGGVEVLDVTPADGSHDPDRVLINLHGGAFTVGWDGVALVESIPMAVLAGYRIVSVNYRMAPEPRRPRPRAVIVHHVFTHRVGALIGPTKRQVAVTALCVCEKFQAPFFIAHRSAASHLPTSSSFRRPTCCLAPPPPSKPDSDFEQTPWCLQGCIRP